MIIGCVLIVQKWKMKFLPWNLFSYCHFSAFDLGSGDFFGQKFHILTGVVKQNVCDSKDLKIKKSPNLYLKYFICKGSSLIAITLEEHQP